MPHPLMPVRLFATTTGAAVPVLPSVIEQQAYNKELL